MFDFNDKVVLVTGGAGNIGGACVKAFAAAGAGMVLADQKSGMAEKFPHLARSSRHLLVSDIDATSEEGNGRLAAEIKERYGRLDVLINTVGGFRAGSAPHETDLDTWDFMLDLNARATFLLCRAMLPLMLDQGGAIVNTAATPALEASADNIAYAASKSAVARITESIAAAYKEEGIRANAILPRIVDTPPNRKAMPNADYSKWIKPDDLAQLYLFLASENGRVVNGALIPATG